MPHFPKISKLPDFDPTRHRHWVSILKKDKQADKHNSLRVLSFNVLNQSYMWPQVYNSYVAKEYRSWDYRLSLLQNTVTNPQFQSGIMCFQEMESKSFKQIWKPMFRQLGYDGEFIRKGTPGYWHDSKDAELIDGVSVFYDKSQFELIECEKFKIADYFNDTFENDYGMAMDRTAIGEILNSKNQVELIMVLRHLFTDKIIVVSNTHLYWKLSDIKLLQLIVILQALNRVQKRYPNSKVLFMGDFNSSPQSSVYKFLKNDKIETCHPDIAPFLVHPDKEFIENPVRSQSNVFDSIIAENDLFTCFTQHLFGIFDYIWFNSRDFRLTGFLSGVDTSYMKSISGLPNRDYPSDHIPLVAEFEIL